MATASSWPLSMCVRGHIEAERERAGQGEEQRSSVWLIFAQTDPKCSTHGSQSSQTGVRCVMLCMRCAAVASDRRRGTPRGSVDVRSIAGRDRGERRAGGKSRAACTAVPVRADRNLAGDRARKSMQSPSRGQAMWGVEVKAAVMAAGRRARASVRSLSPALLCRVARSQQPQQGARPTPLPCPRPLARSRPSTTSLGFPRPPSALLAFHCRVHLREKCCPALCSRSALPLLSRLRRLLVRLSTFIFSRPRLPPLPSRRS